MAEWARREYGKGDIDKSAQLLLPWWRGEQTVMSDGEFFNAYEIIQNWRMSHAFPLNTFQMGLRQRAKRLDSEAIIAQRMKRFSSLMNKLVRYPHMKLSQMQDLGGCRAIFKNVSQVRSIYSRYQSKYQSTGYLFAIGSHRSDHLKCYDYISNPKADGYRGIHLVGRYSARKKSQEPWNGQRIEIQLRSRLQHAFATAVETVTTFTREPLKFGAGPEEWRRFFSLMGSAIAVREKTTLVENTPRDIRDLTLELKDATIELSVVRRFRTWTKMLRAMPRISTGAFKWLLMVLNVEENTIRVTGYADRGKAQDALMKLEKSDKASKLDVVLVWVKSINDLRAAYPNYYADTKEFVRALTTALKSGRHSNLAQEKWTG